MYGGMIFFSLAIWGFSALLPLSLIVLLLVLIAKKASKNSPEEFPRKIRTVYMYMVMVSALITMITGFVLTWTNAVNLIVRTGASPPNSAIVGLITAIITVIIGGTVFALHAKCVKKK